MKKRFLKKGIAAIMFAAIAAGSMATIVHGAPENSPGRLALDIGSDFTEASRSGDGKKDLEKKSEGAEYELTCYTRLLSDHDEDGITYRTTDQYDMTDVTDVEFSAYTKTEAAATHTFMVYTDTRDSQAYNAWSHKDVTEKKIEEAGSDGAVFNYPDLSPPKGMLYVTQYHRLKVGLHRSYDKKYLYFGVSNKSGVNSWTTSGITLNNRTFISNESDDGSFAFLLKEHKVGALAPDNITVIDKTESDDTDKVHNGEERKVAPALNVEFHGNNADQTAIASNSNTISLYRDDPLVLSYESNVAGLILKEYRLYSDKDGTNLIYTIDKDDLPENVDGSISTTIEFDSELIQNIEKEVGSYQLGDFYIKPVFEPKQVDIIAPKYASNSDQKVEMKLAKDYSATNDGDPNDYVLVDTEEKTWIGRFHINNAKYMGDQLIIDYEKNPSYTGLFELYKCNLLAAEAEENITPKAYFYVNDSAAVDFSEPIEYYCIEINPQMKALADLKLEDDTDNVYNGKEQTIHPATLTYPLSSTTPAGKDKITYAYYTDEECRNKVTGKPVNAGTYYAIATMPGDDNYAESQSNVAKFVIQPAEPNLTATGSQITYGYSLKNSTITGTAKSITEQPITGSFAWKEPNKKPDVGYHNEEVIFTPDSEDWANYTSATCKGKMSVKAANVEIICPNQDITYTGKPVVIEGARATYKDESGNVLDTNQEIRFSYYSDSKYLHKLASAPVDVGTYWVKASVSAGGNFNGKTKDNIELTITPAKASLSQMPTKDGKYRVYFSGAVDEPKGKIALNFSNGSPLSAEVKVADGEVYADFEYKDVKQNALESQDRKVTASYIQDGNYDVTPNEVTFEEDGTFLNKKTKEYDYKAKPQTHTLPWKTDFFETDHAFPDGYAISWTTQDNDVIKVEASGDELKITPQNAGKAFVAGRYKATINAGTENEQTEIRYMLYKIIVRPAKVTVTLDDTESIYNGKTQGGDTAEVKGPDEESVPTSISYTYYNNREDAGNGTNSREELPKAIGTYYLKAAAAATRNYEAGSKIAEIKILPAPISVSIPDKTSTYSGKSMRYDEADATIEGTVLKDGSETEFEPVTGQLSYNYTDEAGKKVDDPINAGKYTVTAKVSAAGNYAEGSATATLEIKKKEGELVIDPDDDDPGDDPGDDPDDKPNWDPDSTVIVKVYDGKPAEIPLSFIDGEGNPLDPEGAGIHYQFRHCRKNEKDVTDEIPTNAGLYYGRAVIGEDSNYLPTYSNTIIIWIKKAPVEVVIPAIPAFDYTGDRITIDSAVVTSNGQDITKESELLYLYYSDQECKKLIKPPKDPGIYYVKAFSKERDNYKKALSEAVTLTINEPEKKPGIPDDDPNSEDKTEDTGSGDQPGGTASGNQTDSKKSGSQMGDKGSGNQTNTGNQSKKIAATGDNTPVYEYLILIFLCGAVVIGMLRKKGRSN